MNRLPPLRLLSVFEAVVRTGSPQRAAGELNVSQPAISQAIRALETHIGATLFDRSSRPPVLTPAGQTLQRAVVEGLGQITNAIEQIRASSRISKESATIACSVGTATYWLMPRLTEFYSSHDNLAVNVMTTAQGTPPLNAEIDLAVRYGLGDWTDGRVIKLFDETVVPVCRPDLADKLHTDALSFTNLPLLHVISGDDNWLSWYDYLRLAKQPQPQVAGRNFTNYVQATQAALDGQGIMLGWTSNTADLVKRGSLVALPFPTIQPEEAFYLVTAPGSEEQPAAQTLAHWLMAQTSRQAA